MRSRSQALWLLHLAVFLWGFTGIFGKLIQQGTLHLVYMRTIIAAAGLALAAWWMGRSLSWRTPKLGIYLLTGLIIAAHWITFYGAIKISTASIAAACLSTSTVFTALLEPFWFKRRIRAYEVVLGIIVVAALLLIFGLESGHRLGIAVGVLSALLSAWFNIINAVLVRQDDAVRISFYEIASVAAAMGLGLLILGDLPPPLWELPTSDIVYHLLLGLVCTSFAFVAGIVVMRQLSPFTVMLTVNLEPVYTILIALLIWGDEERMRTGSYIGIALILACLFANGWFQRRRTSAELAEPDPLGRG
ncbi:MAG: DMT family transporter [Flavobacteriales bacterium]|nr:DMT family transporter [Flavobacteriales bacterium]